MGFHVIFYQQVMPSCWMMLVLVKHGNEEVKRILKINSHVIYFFLETLLAIFQKLNFSSADLYVLA